jgi:hypothetical protein
VIRPSLELLPETACQRRHEWHEVFNALHSLDVSVVDALAADLHALLREIHYRASEPTAGMRKSRTLPSKPESGARAGFDAGKRRKSTKVHLAIYTPGYLLAWHTSAADEQGRALVAPFTEKIQDATSGHIEIVYLNPAYSGKEAAKTTGMKGLDLVVVKRSPGQKGFTLLSERRLLERCFNWISRCRSLWRDFEWLGAVLSSLHMTAFVGVMWHQVSQLLWNKA